MIVDYFKSVHIHLIKKVLWSFVCQLIISKTEQNNNLVIPVVCHPLVIQIQLIYSPTFWYKLCKMNDI